MSMVCPQCNQRYEQQFECPACGCRLMYQLSASKGETFSGEREDGWQQTPWGRILVGLLLAQGLAYGTQHLFTAVFLASDEANRSIWATLWGLVLLHILQGLSLMIGAGLSGAGQHQGTLYGSLIGLIHGLIFLLVQRQTGEILTPVAVYGQPILYAGFGTLGGRIGMLIWKPTPLLNLGETSESGKISWAIFSPLRYLAGPVHYTRVLIGMMIVVIGVLWSNGIMSFILNAGSGTLSITTHLQDRLLLFEISALATLTGAGLAGATTWNGLKQGLCVGVGAGAILFGIQMGSAKMVLETAVFMALTTLFLSMAGGWFGGQLFPPISHRRRSRIHEI